MKEAIRNFSESAHLPRLYGWLVQTRPRGRRPITVLAIIILVSSGLLIANTTNAANTNVLRNGSFEDGFGSQAGCGMVGTNWQCFTNGGAANYGFYDDQWNLTVADGTHSQLLELNAKGITSPDNDRYSGIYQTVRVQDWAQYTLNLSGMIRTTTMDGDPWRYRVQVGWTQGGQADWNAVNNWTDVGWDKYYERTSPGSFSKFSTQLTAEAKFVTVYVRVWRKWGVSGEELDVNFDTITLTGPAPFDGGWGGPAYPTGPQPQPPVDDQHGSGWQPPVDVRPGPPDGWQPPADHQHGPGWQPPTDNQPAPAESLVCGGDNQVYNGGFEQGFNALSVGHVGKSWGSFTNGGAANYGFYDEQWSPVIAEGSHGQLIELNSKGVDPADNDRYAGIYQQLKGLRPGATYELTVKGMLRGAGNADDPYRFEAQWGFNQGFDTEWTHVTNWQGMDFGQIYPRTEPGAVATYKVRFQANAPAMVLFVRGWKKWGITGVEMDLNLDAISLLACRGDKPGHGDPHDNWQPGWQPDKPGHQDSDHQMPPANQCTYTVKPGDWLSSIANQVNIPVNDLLSANSLNDPNLLYVGQVLQLPGCADAPQPPPQPQPESPQVDPPAPSDGSSSYTVQPGDTLSVIAAQFGISAKALAQANNIDNPNWIYVGQVLQIP